MPDSTFSPEIQKRIDALPEDIRKLVYSADMDAVIQRVGQKHGLHIDQMGALEAETAAVMIGMTEHGEFSENIADTLNVNQQKARALAEDISNELFAKVRNSMKDVYEKTKVPSPVISQAAPPPAPPPPPPAPPKAAQGTAPFPSTSSPKEAPRLPSVTAADLALTQRAVTPPKPSPALPATGSTNSPQASSGQATPPQKPEPPKPADYKTDPYREPVE
jgi:hypothetical protein